MYVKVTIIVCGLPTSNANPYKYAKLQSSCVGFRRLMQTNTPCGFPSSDVLQIRSTSVGFRRQTTLEDKIIMIKCGFPSSCMLNIQSSDVGFHRHVC
jgi:hypothetical protein